MPPKPKGLTSKKMAEASEEGGIDVLPDALLQHILSFLSADEAVKTCVLSRRWRHLWKSTPILRIVKTEDRWDWESFQDFNRFVNTLLVHRGRSRISKFELEFSSLGGYEFDLDSTIFPHFMIWIMYALICQVQVLKIHNFMFSLIEMDGSMPLVSQHLMKIELSGILFDYCFLDFSSCLVLEHICFSENCSFYNIKKILSQSVKYLSFYLAQFCDHHRTHNYAPNLIRLHLDILWGRVPFLESMPSLVAGFVRTQQDCDDHCSNTYSGNCANCNGCRGMIDETGNDSAKCMLLGGLSEAKNLELIAEPEMHIFRSDLRWCPFFSKLKSLLLNEWCVANNFWALVCVLKHSPVLENFTLQISKDTKSMIETEENYNVLLKPAITSKHLKSSVSRKKIWVQILRKNLLREVPLLIIQESKALILL